VPLRGLRHPQRGAALEAEEREKDAAGVDSMGR
jgi:hypothetical protein